MNEDILASRAGAGDVAAFAALLRQHQSQLRGFLHRLAKGDRSLADDLAQETFLEAWRKRAQFRGRGSYAGWLMRIAWTRFLMEARRRKPLALEEADMAGEVVSASPDTRLDIEAAMRKLSAAERAAITLCYAFGHSGEEAAEILAMPLGTVKSHLLRGREKLKGMLLR